MNITILDFAIIAVPLVILSMALVSRVRGTLSRREDEVNRARKALRRAHIEALQAKANQTLTPVSKPRSNFQPVAA